MGTDPYGDVTARNLTDGSISVVDIPYLDLKEHYLASNATTVFVKIVVWGMIKDGSAVYNYGFGILNLTGLHNAVSEDGTEITFNLTGIVSYCNGTATFDDKPINAYHTKDTLFMEIPIKYLAESRCINNSKIVPVNRVAKEEKVNWKGETEYVYSDGFPSNVQVYYYLEDINTKPDAHITSINPNPARHGDIIYFSGDGWDPENDTIKLKWKVMDHLWIYYPDPNSTSIMAYEWYSSIDGFLSTNSSFNTTNLSVGDHIIYFRVKDSGGKWSDNATTILIVKEKVADGKVDHGWQKYLPHIIMLVTIGSVIGWYLCFCMRKRK